MAAGQALGMDNKGEAWGLEAWAWMDGDSCRGATNITTTSSSTAAGSLRRVCCRMHHQPHPPASSLPPPPTPCRTYADMAGEELFNKYQTVIFLAGSASAEFFADIALAPFEAVKVGGRGDQGGVEAGVWGGWKGRSGRGVGSRGVWGDGRFGGGCRSRGV